MKCVVCRQAETQIGTTTVTLERADLTLVFKNVPAQVCPNCGESYVDEQTSGQLLRDAEETARAGTKVEVREFAAV